MFGRVPLFYFIVHFWAAHMIAAVMLWLHHGNPGLFWNGPPAIGGPRPENYGYALWVVYAVWISLVVMLYPVCRWFARLKERHRDWGG